MSAPTKLKANVLVVDDDPGHRTMLSTLLKGWGYVITTAEDGSQAVEAVRAAPFDLVIMDVRMAVMDGIEALRRIKEYNPSVPVLIMTAYSTVESAVEALKSGAYDYLTKPLDFDVLRLAMERALDHTSLKIENSLLKKRRGGPLPDIIGRSEPMRKLLDMVAMVAPSEATVLVTGESGTGKELVSRLIHDMSGRKDGPLVAVNCAALTETLLESELFGHERGAFTGAERRREGRFKQADTGTLFLDEIGEVSPAMQVKLLRAIQEREVHRVGGDEPVKVDVRLLAATNRDLAAEVEAGRFRQDLYFRLNVVNLHVPALRERDGDIPLLAAHFLERFAERNRKPVRGFTPRAMDALVKHGWPGNVRELENAVERAVVLMTGDWITERDLPLSITQPQAARSGDPAGRSLEEIEREAILATLSRTGGNKSEAARLLGITRKTLHAKLARYEGE